MVPREWWQIEVEDNGWRLETKDGKSRHIWRLRKQLKPIRLPGGKVKRPRDYKYIGKINNDN